MKIINTIIIICCLSLPGCDKMMLGDEELINTAQYLELPPALDDGIGISSPSQEGLDSAKLYGLIARLQQEGSNGIRSVLVTRNNKLVVEGYFNGWHRERRQDLRSASKSFVSAVMGIAIDKGIVKSVDEKVLDYFPEYDNLQNWDEQKAETTIRDFLRMRTGLQCNDWANESPGNQEKMYVTDDWLKFIFDLPVSNSPGTRFSYCSGAPIIMSAVVAKTSGTTSFEFAKENLLTPLGINNYVWEYMPARPEYAGGQLHMRPRDFLKFGLLFLNDGTWNGTRIISSEWIEESTRPDGDVPGQRPGTKYGYYWWYTSWTINGKTINAYYANGNGGQLMYILKELNMVVAFTGGAYNSSIESRVYTIMQQTILPAVLE
jgi:CubicO group peptidase (beta-lactamase class C family)